MTRISDINEIGEGDVNGTESVVIFKYPSSDGTPATGGKEYRLKVGPILQSGARAEAAAGTATEKAAQTSLSAEAAAAAEARAIAAANAAGPVKLYRTYAAALADVASHASGAFVDALVDETMDGDHTRYEVVDGALVFALNLDRWRADLANPAKGAGIVAYGASTAASVFDGVRPISYYGTLHDDLISLLLYARASGKPIRLDIDVTMTSDISIDFAGAVLKFDCAGHAIQSDHVLEIKSVGRGSELIASNPRNITVPQCITRWDENGDWITDDDAVLATLKPTNDPGYYQPGENDGNRPPDSAADYPGGVFYRLPQAVKDQNISARVRIYGAQDFVLRNPKGRHCLYEFVECNGTRVIDADIESGGKGKYGTILFTNMETSGYGVDNRVIGGTVRYGTFSAITFMRQRLFGVDGLQAYRPGESGIKTYQNNEKDANGANERSARCYQGVIIGNVIVQSVFDGIDVCSDYGSTAQERIDDYSLAQFPWHTLPTKHTVNNNKTFGCRRAGLWGDGSNNNYESHHAEECGISGIKLISDLSKISRASVVNCNLSNAASGEHQITVTGENSQIEEPTTFTDSRITAGYAIYTAKPTTKTVGGAFLGTRTATLVYRRDEAFDNIALGTYSTTETEVSIAFQPRGSLINNPAGAVTGRLTLSTPGIEAGNVSMKGAYDGALKKGFTAYGDRDGVGRIAVASSLTTNLNINGSLILYEGPSGDLRARFQNASGAVHLYQFTLLA